MTEKELEENIKNLAVEWGVYPEEEFARWMTEKLVAMMTYECIEGNFYDALVIT